MSHSLAPVGAGKVRVTAHRVLGYSTQSAHFIAFNVFLPLSSEGYPFTAAWTDLELLFFFSVDGMSWDQTYNLQHRSQTLQSLGYDASHPYHTYPNI